MPKEISQKIIDFNKGRLVAMLAWKYKFMAENLFRFYRGTCHLFYEELSKRKDIPVAPPVWICGDLHLENFGSYKGDNRLVYFDLNDFDEGILAPASWEIIRLMTSIFIAFRSLKISEQKARNMAQLCLKSYASTMAGGKPFYIEPKTAKGIVSTFLEATSKRKQKHLIRRRVNFEKNNAQINTTNPKHFEIDRILKRELCHHITEWILQSNDGPYNYEVKDAMFRLAGTSSVGLRRYVFLLQSLIQPKKYILLEMKQAKLSSLQPYVQVPQPYWISEAERIVEIQKRMQNIPPALLSHTIFKGEPYIIQEMEPVKDSINFNLIRDRYRDIYQVISDMGMLTASSQLRSSGRQGSATTDALIEFGKNEKWRETILKLADEITHKVKDQYKYFLKDYKAGKFKTQDSRP